MSSVLGASDPPLHRVTVVGLGVMGGSLAQDLSARGAPVRGWSPEEGERRAALAAGALQEAPGTLEEALADAEMVVLATPLDAVCRLLPRVAEAAPRAVLTDVASLKAPVERAARAVGVEGRWVGSHPMCGSEGSGFGAGRMGLYRGARVWTVAHPAAEAAREAVDALWRSVGAEPAPVEAGEHDRLMALASHLPQLTANALASVLGARGVAPSELGPGGRDMTRLAGSSPEMWRDLLAAAPGVLPEALEELGGALAALAHQVREGRSGELASLMEATRRWRREGDPGRDG